MAQPVIGLTLDSEPPGRYSKTHRWYALRENYCSAVIEAGGLPILLPHEPDQVAAYLDVIAGLVVTGGAFDVDPALFGAASRHASVTTKDRRTWFELALTKSALAADRPILGICGGQQLLNVALGGTLIQHIPDEVPQALAHEQPNPRTEPGHKVRIERGTLLHRITQCDEMAVNSAHHQAVKDTARECHHRRARARRRHRRHRGSASAVLSRRAMASGIRALAGRSADLRRLRRRLPIMPEEASIKGERVAKLLARAGLCSRRDAERWIAEGRVSVAGKVLTSPAVNVVDPGEISVDGKPLKAAERPRLWRYHKPARDRDHASRRERAADGLRQVAGRPAARDFGRAARPQFRGAAALDQ